MIKEVIESSDDTKEHTIVGNLPGKLKNQNDIEELNPVTITEVFKKIKEEVGKYYE